MTEFENATSNSPSAKSRLVPSPWTTVTLGDESHSLGCGLRSTATMGFVSLNRSSAAPQPAPTSMMRSVGRTAHASRKKR